MVYLLMAAMLFIAMVHNSWGLIAFVMTMLLLAVIIGWCPSKWLFEKIGFKKTQL